jgi:sugar phosphate isomerase/epimerase
LAPIKRRRGLDTALTKGRENLTKPKIFTCNWTLFPVMDTVEAARFTAREGFAGIELECTPLGFWPTTLSQSVGRELAAIGRGEGIGYTVHAPDSINPATDLPEAKVRDNEIFRSLVELAKRLSSPVVGIHPGVVHTLFALERRGVPFATDRYNPDDLVADGRKRAVETYGQWGDLCAEAGLTLTVENEVHVRHSVAPTAEILAEMVEGTGRDNIKVNLDTGHAYIGAGLAEEFNVLKGHVVHMHLDDGRTPGVSEHLPLGEGLADFSLLADFMATMEGALVLEIYAPDRPVEATLESRDYLLELIGESSHKITHPKHK